MDAKDFYTIYADLSKHLVTLAVALLTLSITFIDKLKANLKTKKEYSLLIWIWVLLICSIFAALLSSYLCIDQSLKCAAADEGCIMSTLMKVSIISNLIIFTSCFILMAVLGYKALSNSKKDSTNSIVAVIQPTLTDPVSTDTITETITTT
jgi:heme/copper-type cytochrome/quinol oxidase subunit 3